MTCPEENFDVSHAQELWTNKQGFFLNVYIKINLSWTHVIMIYLNEQDIFPNHYSTQQNIVC